MKLNFKVFGEGKPLVVLHGLLGSLDNWLSMAKRFGESGFRCYIIDQRNHGKSPHSDEHSFDAMADDLLEFMQQHQLEKASVIGHSMGGKTAMFFALKYPQKIEKLIVVDMGVKQYGGGHEEIFKALNSIDPAAITSRGEAEAKLEEQIPDAGMRLFLLKNLDRNDQNGFEWKMNLEAMQREYPNMNAPVEGTAAGVDALFIRGEKSNYIKDEDIEGIRQVFPEAEFVTIPSAGHWVHAEAPDAFFDAAFDFLK